MIETQILLILKLCFSSINVSQNFLKGSSKYRLLVLPRFPGSVVLGWGLGICISNKFSTAAAVASIAGPGTIL